MNKSEFLGFEFEITILSYVLCQLDNSKVIIMENGNGMY